MKNFRLPLVGFALVLLITSCKKQDVQLSNVSKSSTAFVAAKASGWNSLNSWSTSRNDTVTTYFSSISDTSLNADVAKSGLVLVYTKNGSGTQSLPYLDKSSNTYWYYQVAKGSIRINGDNGSSTQNFNGQNFFYFVLTSQQVANLQVKGRSKLDLMQLNYDQAQSLLK